MKNGKVIGAVATVLFLTSVAANAATVEYQATGSINLISGDVGGLPAGFDAVTIGQNLTIDWTVNTDTAGSNPISSVLNTYAGALTAVSLQLGSATTVLDLSGGADSVTIYNNAQYEPFTHEYQTGYLASARSGPISLPQDFSGTILSASVETLRVGNSFPLYSSSALTNAPLDPAVGDYLGEISLAYYL